MRNCSTNLKIITSLVFCGSIAFAAQDTNVQGSSATMPTPSPVTSNDQWRPHFGLLASVVTPEGSFDPGIGYGIDIGFQPYIPFGLGLEITRSENEGRRSNSDIEQTAALARFTYNFGGTHWAVKNSFAGIGLGQVYKGSRTELAGAPIIGFDVPIQDRTQNYLTVGANAKYLIIDGNDPDVTNVNATLKYWF